MCASLYPEPIILPSMVLNWINVYTETLKSQPEWLLLLLFVVAFIEALALVGVVIPGIVILFALSMAIGLEPKLFLSAWFVASMGAFLGDAVSFWLGRHWQPKHQGELLDRARALFAHHGGKSIFLGRFIGPIRPVIPLVGGMLNVRWQTFLVFAIPACLLWAPVYLLPGMIFGASIELAAQVAGRLAVLMVLLVMATWLGLWVVRQVYSFSAKRSGWWLKRWVQWGHRHPVIGRWVGDLLRPGSREVVAIAWLGLLLSLSVSALIVLLVFAPALAPQWSEPFHPATWASSLRNPWADPLMATLSLVGDRWVVSCLGLLMLGVFLISRRFIAAGHWIAALVGVFLIASGMNALMSWLMIEPELSAAAHPSLTELPHRGFALWVTALSFFALMVAKDLNAKARKWPYLVATVFIVPVGLAHFYLELASLLGLATAIALGLGWSALVGIGYRHRALITPFQMRWIGVFVVGWLVFSWSYVDRQLDVRLDNSEVPLVMQTMSPDEWLSGEWRSLPRTRSVFGPLIERQIDVQIAGELSSIQSLLESAGWRVAPALDFAGLMAGFASEPMHWPRALNGRPESLLMFKPKPQPGQRDVIRLWPSGVLLTTFEDSRARPVWLGQVRRVELDVGVIGLKRWEDSGDVEPLESVVSVLANLPTRQVRSLDAQPNASSDSSGLQDH